MGEEANRPAKQVIRAVDGDGTRDSGKSTSSTSTTSGRIDGRTDGRTDGSTINGRTTAEEKEISRLAIVDEEQRKRDERNAKRRERYAQKKAEKGETVKPRKVNNTKTKTKSDNGKEQISAILSTVSTMVASRQNMVHWQLTPKEVDSIAEPLSNILAKSEAFQTLGEHSDSIALMTACATVLLPRIVITGAQLKERKKEDVGRNKKPTGREQRVAEKRKDSDIGRRNERGITNDNETTGADTAFYGDALSM